MHGNLFVLIFVASDVVVAAAAALTYVKILNLCSGKNKMSAKTATTETITHTCISWRRRGVAGRRSVAFQLSGQSVAGGQR